jgi:hypothetical protein
MEKIAKVTEAFVCELANGLKVTFDLSYGSRKDSYMAGPITFELRMQAPGEKEEKRVFEGDLDIEVHARGHMEQLRWYADIELKNGKPFEVQGNNWSHTFRGKGPSFWPTDRTEWKITDLTSEGYRISVPSYSLRNLRVEFFPREIRPPQEVDI